MQLFNVWWLGFWSVFLQKRCTHTHFRVLIRMLLLLQLFPLTLVALFEPGSSLVWREFSHMQATVTTTQHKFIHYPNQSTRAGSVPVSAADIHLYRGGREGGEGRGGGQQVELFHWTINQGKWHINKGVSPEARTGCRDGYDYESRYDQR